MLKGYVQLALRYVQENPPSLVLGMITQTDFNVSSEDIHYGPKFVKIKLKNLTMTCLYARMSFLVYF